MINQSIFRAYDIRGIYPSEINEDIVYKIAQAFAYLYKPQNIVLGHDVRMSGKSLSDAAQRGFTDAGVDVIYIGEISTDMMYFTVAHYGYDGGFAISASHNPVQYNGVKMVRKGDIPIAGDSGIEDIKNFVLSDQKIQSEKKGNVVDKFILDDYCFKILSFLTNKISKNYKIAANANFGMSGIVLRKLIEMGNLPIEVLPLNFIPDGTFPKGPPDPLIPALSHEIEEFIKSNNVDFGIAWDGDADRCFFYDQNGDFLSGYFTTAVLSRYFLNEYPGCKIICDPRLIWAVRDTVNDLGGQFIVSRAGHSFIKERMRREDAVFAGEMSGHYYFKDNYFSDNGMIPLIIMLQILESSLSIADVYKPYLEKYFISEEIDMQVANNEMVMNQVKDKYFQGSDFSQIDGYSFEYQDWRFNLRPSNTEPLLRLNVESLDQNITQSKTKEILDLMEKYKSTA